MLLDAIKKVKPALARQDIVQEFKHFLIKDGYIYAQDGRLTAGAPIGQDLGHFLVPAQELERVSSAFEATGEEVEVKVTDKNLLLSTSSYKARIRIADPQVFQVKHEEPAEVFAVKEDFFKALSIVRPFISDNATQMWAMGAYINGSQMYATNNVCLIRVDITDFHFKGMLPLWAIDFILARWAQNLKHIAGDENSLWMQWDDGSWMRTQLIQGQFPEKGVQMLAELQEATFVLTPEWKRAYGAVSTFAKEELYVYADKIYGKHDTMEMDAEIESPVPPELEYSKWTTKFLNPIVAIAEAVDLQSYPQAAAFSGKQFRGVIVGRR